MLADPVKHWKSGYSARTLAYSWEAADGFPSEVAAPFARSTEPLLENITPVLAIPEFKVPLPGGVRASQNDIFVLARSSSGPVSIMVEGKVKESFGPTLDEWRSESSPGKEERLSFLLRTLGLGAAPAENIRYQLLHRAASAIITGAQCHAVAAVLLVNSFSQERAGWPDYQRLRIYLESRQSLVRFNALEVLPPFHSLASGSWATRCSCKADAPRSNPAVHTDAAQ